VTREPSLQPQKMSGLQPIIAWTRGRIYYYLVGHD
jgi:hypothetical protein